ncbi:MAG: tRNA uridine-5-carboxymethylaminomethyl(34) synthesis GTPase MnmE [Oscillospiraceae bacterium]|nr:tRNA uridine-5-carboxymethylaminomethyl(34) synthesis GTPase MnmE [Oscillospiraceae bacterium]
MSQERTIAAISTPQGTGGISVIRISGDDAVEIADSVFTGKLLGVETHTVHYGYIKNKNGERLDEVLVTVMLAPRTFTRENTVEISCHGGSVSTRAVLNAVIEAGAFPAEPGEFTKRAFMNGRIDLSQAEAVIDIINAKNELSRRNAVSQLGGTLSKEIKSVRDELVHLSAQMQVLIDYPDEDLADVTPEDIEAVCRSCEDRIKRLIRSADSGRIIKEGIKCAIVGKPNVGKSSILNYLAQEERAIVTDVAGTTRDVIEESVSINGIPLILSDTAGIHDTEDTVEKIGVEKSKRYIDAADLVIVVIDSAIGIDDEDKAVLKETEGKKRIVLYNKSDISDANISDGIAVSAVTGDGMDTLAQEISRLCGLDEIQTENGTVITNMRHKAALIGASDALSRAAEALAVGMPTDIVSIDISAAMDSLGEITGETVRDSVVNDIFHNFCVGK